MGKSKVSVALEAMKPEDASRAMELIRKVGPEALELVELYLRVYEIDTQQVQRNLRATADELRWSGGGLHVVLSLREDLGMDVKAR